MAPSTQVCRSYIRIQHSLFHTSLLTVHNIPVVQSLLCVVATQTPAVTYQIGSSIFFSNSYHHVHPRSPIFAQIITFQLDKIDKMSEFWKDAG